MTATDTHSTIETVFRIESPKLIAGLAVGMAYGPAAGLALVEPLTAEPSLRGYHLLFAVRGDLLTKVGRWREARVEFERAASLAKNGRERGLLLERAARCPEGNRA